MLLHIDRELTSSGRRVLRVEADRETLLACDHKKASARWAFGDTPRDETRRRLTENDPTDRLRSLYDKERLRLDAALAETFSQATARRRRRVRSEDGDEIDVSRYLQEPERLDFWRALAPDTRPHRIVRLAFDYCVSGAATPQEIAASAALAAATVDVLQRAGIGSEVDVIYTVPAGGRAGFRGKLLEACDGGSEPPWLAMRTLWCAASEPLDEGALAVLGLPGLCRNHGFGLLDSVSLALGGAGADDCGTYGGSVSEWPSDLLSHLGYDAVFGARWSTAKVMQMIQGIALNLRDAA